MSIFTYINYVYIIYRMFRCQYLPIWVKYKNLTSLYTALSFPIYNVKCFLHIYIEPHETIVMVAETLLLCFIPHGCPRFLSLPFSFSQENFSFLIHNHYFFNHCASTVFSLLLTFQPTQPSPPSLPLRPSHLFLSMCPWNGMM